jgi:hypothetical protein
MMYQKMSELNNIVHRAGFALVEVSQETAFATANAYA